MQECATVLFHRKKTKKKNQKSKDNMLLKLIFVIWVIAREHIGTQSTQSMLAREHAMHVGTLARKHERHVSTQGTGARKHARHFGTWASEHVSIQDTLAREHISTQGTLPRQNVSTQFSRLEKSRSQMYACVHSFKFCKNPSCCHWWWG